MTIREHIALLRHDLEIKRTAFFLAQDLLLAEGDGFQDRSLFERLSQAEPESGTGVAAKCKIISLN